MEPALQTARQIVELVVSDADHPDRQARLALLLDKIAFEMHAVNYASNLADVDAPRPDYPAIRAHVERNFPGFGYYNTVLEVSVEVGDSKLCVGDAVDDLADIVLDLQEALWILENQNEHEAKWRLIWGYENHWRAHLRGLQTYLHFASTDT